MHNVKDVLNACKSEKIIRANYRGLYGPFMDQCWALTLWEKHSHFKRFSLVGQLPPLKDVNTPASCMVRLIKPQVSYFLTPCTEVTNALLEKIASE